MTVDTSADGLTLHCDITCADQAAWNTYKALMTQRIWMINVVILMSPPI